MIVVKATLRTRCGCWKHEDVPFPPPPEILVKLKTRPLTTANQVEPMPLEIRRFRLQDFGKDYADYEESPTL